MRAQLALLVLLTACPSPAPVPEVQVGPDPADTTDDLVAVVADGLSVTLAWTVDGAPADVVGPRVPASMTSRGQVWTVEATAHGEADTQTATATVTIRNARPRVTLDLAPDEPDAGDALVVASVAFDADGDPLTTRHRWYRNDVLVEDLVGDRVPADTTRRADTWRVEVSANDGFAWSEPVSASVQIANGAPEVRGGGIQPSAPTASDTLVASADIIDPDGDALTIRYVWRIDGAIVQDGPSARLLPGPFERGDTVALHVGASDDGTEPDVVPVASIVIANSPPGAPAVRITPTEPIAGQSLRCEVATPAVDPDGDAIVTYAAAWTVDGLGYEGAVDATWITDRVRAEVTQGDQLWRCTLRAFDGESWGVAGSASVEVAWGGFQGSQTLGGRTVTCKSVDNTSSSTTCVGLRVLGQAFPNGLTCSTGWSGDASPWTDHAAFCRLVTGRSLFEADYTCGVIAERVTYVGGTWGTRSDNGLSDSLRCFW